VRLAIIKLSALGDIVHASFLPQIIKKEYPHIIIDWFVEKRFSDILENNPYIDSIITVNLKDNKNNIAKEIQKIYLYKKNNYDRVIDLQGLIKSASIAKILGNGCGFDKNSIREKLASFFYKKKFFIPYEQNVILRNYMLTCKCLNFKIDINSIKDKEKSLFYTNKNLNNISQHIAKNKKNILLVMGSSWESKVYPKEKYLSIIRQTDANFLLSWGSQKEKKDALFISKNSNAILLENMSLNELKALIDSCDLVIGGDSGPTHMAWALNKPSITIFGPTPKDRNTFKTNINLTVDCEKKINPLKLDKNDLCIKNIDENKIIKLINELLYG